MSSENLMSGLFIVVGIILLVRAYLIGVNKKTNLISGLDKDKLKRVKNLDKLTKDYSKALVLMACASFVAVITLLYLGAIGKILGLAIIILASINLSRITLNVELKGQSKRNKLRAK